MNLVKLFAAAGLCCCKPAYNWGPPPPVRQVLFLHAKPLAPLRRVRPAWPGGRRRPAAALRAGAPLSDPPVTRKPDRLPAQDPAAHRLGRRRPPGGIRGGAPRHRDYRRSPGCHEKGHFGRRRRAFLFATGGSTISAFCGRPRATSRPARSRGPARSPCRWPAISSSPAKRQSPGSCGRSCSPGRSRPTSARTRSSSSTSTRSFWASGPTASRQPPRSISASRCRT